MLTMARENVENNKEVMTGRVDVRRVDWRENDWLEADWSNDLLNVSHIIVADCQFDFNYRITQNFTSWQYLCRWVS